MTGPSERKLEKVLSADPGQVRGAGRAWQVAAEGLQQVADALDSAQGDLADAWRGRDATAATAAFSTLGGSVRANQGRMQTAAEALDGAAEALAEAQRAHASLPTVPPEPTFPEAGDDGQVSSDQEIRYIKLLGVHRSAANEREAQAESAYQTLVAAMGDSSQKLGTAAPESTDRTWGNTPATTTPTGSTPTGSTPGTTGLPVLGGGGGSVSGSGGGGTAHAVGTGATGFVGSVHHPTDVTSATTSGVVGSTNPTSTAPLGQGHVAPAPVEVVGEGASGGMAAAGVLGGAGGALGAARAAAGGRLSPAIGRVVGAGTTAAGAARPAATGATARTPLGGTARATGSSVLGASGRTGATTASGATGTTGTTAASRGAGSTAAATRGGTTPVGGGTQGTSGGAGRGAGTSGGSGGRYSAPQSTRGGQPAATGSRPSGAAPGGRGAGGAGAMGRGGGGTQDERTARRPSMLIDDEDAWLDDDDSNPGVIR